MSAALTGLLASGCADDGVDARAIWVDGSSGDRLRRIHIYDRGRRSLVEVAGEAAPQEFVRLGPRGRGVFVRLGSDQGSEVVGAWLSLVDGRRLPLAIPPLGLSSYPVGFSELGDALLWLDGGDLELVGLAQGLALERDERGVVASASFPGPWTWAVSAAQVPIVLVGGDDGAASFVRYPQAPGEPVELAELGRVEGLSLPGEVAVSASCAAIRSCASSVSLAPGGERAIVEVEHGAVSFATHTVVDRRAGALSGPLALPPALAALAEVGDLSPLAVLGPRHSVWTSTGQLHLWDERLGAVDSLPVFVDPPFRWARTAGGQALSLASAQGPLIRVDAEGIELISVDSSTCSLPAAFAPVFSPDGRSAAWTCVDAYVLDPEPSAEEQAPSVGDIGSVVRVSVAGLERYAGVPMQALAIDDEGDLLLNSVISTVVDEVGGISPLGRPRNLFVLTRGGVLSRVDDLEPGPAPVLTDTGRSIYIQARSL